MVTGVRRGVHPSLLTSTMLSSNRDFKHFRDTSPVSTPACKCFLLTREEATAREKQALCEAQEPSAAASHVDKALCTQYRPDGPGR